MNQSRRIVLAALAALAFMPAAWAADGPATADLPRGLSAWRSYRGNIGAGQVADGGMALVGAEDVGAIREVWVSEEQSIPKGWLHPNGLRTVGLSGGYGSPVAVGDHVYIAWWEPDADSAVCPVAMETAVDKNPDRWRVGADEILLCMDVKTGKTLWKTRLEGTGFNDQFGNHCKNYVPAVADGAVVLSGNGGWLYCLEPADGSLRWKAKLGAYADDVQAYVKAGIVCGDFRRGAWKNAKKAKEQEFGSLPRLDDGPVNSNPLIVEGLVVAGDLTAPERGRSCGLVAYDLAGGAERWRVPDCVDGFSSPVLWRHGGKAYVVAAGRDRVVAVDPANGEIRWEIPFDAVPEIEVSDGELAGGKWRGPPGHKMPKHFINLGTPALMGDFLVLKGNRPNPHPERFIPAPHTTGPTCWELGGETPSLRWRLPRNQDMFCPQKNSWVIYRGHLFVMGRQGSCIVNLATGEQVSTYGRGRGRIGDSFSSPVAGDGRVFHSATMHILEDPAKVVSVKLRVKLETYTQPFYANGFLFTRGPIEPENADELDKEARQRAARNAVYCYDLRKK